MDKKTLVIFGSDGQLGTDLSRVFAQKYNIVSASHVEVDITNEGQIRDFIKREQPELVLNAAGYNTIEKAAEEIEQAYAVNAFGPYYIARAAEAAGAFVVHISTDYVFDGTKSSYTESDSPNPLNVYGASKYAGETLVGIASEHSYIIRTSALFGTAREGGKKNFVHIMLEKGKEGNVRVVSDQRTVPTSTSDLAAAISKLVEAEAPYGIYHLTNEGSATWAEFAEAIFREREMTVTVIPIPTTESGTTVRRPASTVLMSEKLTALGITLPTWQDALKRYLSQTAR